MTDRELMQMALDALCCFVEYDFKGNPVDVQSIEGAKAIEALRARLAQPNEPDWSAAGFGKPPQREWVGLTDEQVKQIEMSASSTLSAIYLAEAQLKGKNT